MGFNSGFKGLNTSSLLIKKANEMYYFSNLFDKFSTCFRQVHCPPSGVTQHCIHSNRYLSC